MRRVNGQGSKHNNSKATVVQWLGPSKNTECCCVWGFADLSPVLKASTMTEWAPETHHRSIKTELFSLGKDVWDNVNLRDNNLVVFKLLASSIKSIPVWWCPLNDLRLLHTESPHLSLNMESWEQRLVVSTPLGSWHFFGQCKYK